MKLWIARTKHDTLQSDPAHTSSIRHWVASLLLRTAAIVSRDRPTAEVTGDRSTSSEIIPDAAMSYEDNSNLLGENGGPPAHWLAKVREGAPELLFAPVNHVLLETPKMPESPIEETATPTMTAKHFEAVAKVPFVNPQWEERAVEDHRTDFNHVVRDVLTSAPSNPTPRSAQRKLPVETVSDRDKVVNKPAPPLFARIRERFLSPRGLLLGQWRPPHSGNVNEIPGSVLRQQSRDADRTGWKPSSSRKPNNAASTVQNSAKPDRRGDHDRPSVLQPKVEARRPIARHMDPARKVSDRPSEKPAESWTEVHLPQPSTAGQDNPLRNNRSTPPSQEQIQRPHPLSPCFMQHPAVATSRDRKAPDAYPFEDFSEHTFDEGPWPALPDEAPDFDDGWLHAAAHSVRADHWSAVNEEQRGGR